MKLRRVIIGMTVLLACAISALPAQTTVDPNDPLYADLQLWQDRGLIHDLPPLRPYPVQLVRRYLTEVVHLGSADDRARADRYLASLTGEVNAHIVPSAQVRSDLSSAFEQVGAAVVLQGSIDPLVSYSAVPGVYAQSGSPDALLPQDERSTTDVQYDGSVKPLFSTGLTPRISLASDLSIGSPELYLQAGIMRDSFGPFWDQSVVLSPDAPEAGRISYTWNGSFLTYTSLFQAVTATTDSGTGRYPDKFLVLHSLEARPLSWLRLGILESVVWGDRFEPLYLLPFPAVLFYAQGLVGYPDNSFIGLEGGVTLPDAVRLDGVLYVDDAGFNNLIKLDFNTMFVAAAQTGVSWTPNLPFLTRLSVSYLLVTPYTYSHRSDYGADGINYENYTNDGENMGPDLEPNSDRLALEALVRPLPFLDTTIFGRFIRHANASIGITGGGNGTIFDDGYVNGVPTFTNGAPSSVTQYTRFLSQSVLEETAQAGVSLSAHFDTPVGEVRGTLGYTFQYIANAVDPATGDPQAGKSSTANYVSVGFSLSH